MENRNPGCHKWHPNRDRYKGTKAMGVQWKRILAGIAACRASGAGSKDKRAQKTAGSKKEYRGGTARERHTCG